MKSIFTSFLFTLAAILCAQNVTIPDANFKNALLTHDPVIDTNSDGEIQVSEAEALAGTLVFENAAISDLTGLEAFVNVNAMYCSQNEFTSMPISTMSNLSLIVAWDNQLESLDVSQNPLVVRIDVGGNNMSELDITHNPALIELSIGNNAIGNLDLSNNPLLERFYSTNGNTHTFLDFSSNPALNTLVVQNLSDLEFVNIQNGNTANILTFNLTGLPALECVRVDPGVIGNIPDSWVYDEGTNFSADCTMGTVDLKEVEIRIYPNPTRNQLFIDSNENLEQIEIFSVTGEKIMTKNELNNQSINVSNLNTGTYIIRMKTESGKTYSQKFIKN